MIPLDGCYMLQRYRPDFDDWVNFAVYDSEAAALRRLNKYPQALATMTNNDILKLAQEAGIHSAIIYYSYGSTTAAMTERERQDFAAIQLFAKLLISALKKP